MSDLKDLLADPKIQAAMGVLEPALPILVEMAIEKAVEVVQGLASEDSADAIFELRKSATHDQWLAFSKSLIAKGNAKALQEVLDRDNLIRFLLQLIISGYQAVKAAGS